MGFALRGPILWASRQSLLKRALIAFPPTRVVVRRFVAGEHLMDAVRVARELRNDGLLVSIDHLGEHVTDEPDVDANVREASHLVSALSAAGLAEGAEISIKLSALGQSLDDDLAYQSALRIARTTHAAGMLLTIDMESHASTDRTLATVRRLRAEVPTVGVAIQAMLRRTPGDLSDLRGAGSRIRLVKGAYDEPEDVAVQHADEIQAAYAAALEQLFTGAGYPMVGTHNPALIAHALELADRRGKGTDGFELQMLYGIRAAEQRHLVAAGHRVRTYVPYGTDWYGYLTRRLAEKPANLLLFLRALAPERKARAGAGRAQDSLQREPAEPGEPREPAEPSAAHTPEQPRRAQADGAGERNDHGRAPISPDPQ